jgi:hypothetical protein
MSASTTEDGGALESGGDDGELTVTDARTGDAKEKDARERDVASDGSEGGAGDDDGAPNGDNTSSSRQSCCVGGAFYVCPNAAALAQCASACWHLASYDSACLSYDGGTSNVGVNVPAPPPVPTNACGGMFLGFSCNSGQCSGLGHCTRNLCFPNDVGNPCTYPDDCGDGNHCTNGCCASPAKGSPCEAFWDCKSKNCTNGVCQ